MRPQRLSRQDGLLAQNTSTFHCIRLNAFIPYLRHALISGHDAQHLCRYPTTAGTPALEGVLTCLRSPVLAALASHCPLPCPRPCTKGDRGRAGIASLEASTTAWPGVPEVQWAAAAVTCDHGVCLLAIVLVGHEHFRSNVVRRAADGLRSGVLTTGYMCRFQAEQQQPAGRQTAGGAWGGPGEDAHARAGSGRHHYQHAWRPCAQPLQQCHAHRRSALNPHQSTMHRWDLSFVSTHCQVTL